VQQQLTERLSEGFRRPLARSEVGASVIDEVTRQLTGRFVVQEGAASHDQARAEPDPPYKLPRSIERVDEPLRDDAGKVRRSAFRTARLTGL
jgi:hypothetical protein